jgi:hypothetical protein
MEIYVAAKAKFVAGLLAQARAERGLPPETYWDPLGHTELGFVRRGVHP